jgi:hypothetical protein
MTVLSELSVGGRIASFLIEPRRSAHVLPTLPVYVYVEEKTSDLSGLSDILLLRLR